MNIKMRENIKEQQGEEQLEKIHHDKERKDFEQSKEQQDEEKQ